MSSRELAQQQGAAHPAVLDSILKTFGPALRQLKRGHVVNIPGFGRIVPGPAIRKQKKEEAEAGVPLR